MKKTLFIILTIASLASCKKERTCTCTTTVNGIGATTASTTIKDTRSKAKEACEKQNATSSSMGFTTTVACSLQ